MEEAESQWEQLFVNQTKAKGSVSPEPQQIKTVKTIKSKSAQSPINQACQRRYIILLKPFSVIYLHHAHPMADLLYLFYCLQTTAHEIGHNLGMDHDFNTSVYNRQKKFQYRKYNKKSCKGGLMDYGANRNGWSACSARDFSRYITKAGTTKPCTIAKGWTTTSKSDRFK